MGAFIHRTRYRAVYTPTHTYTEWPYFRSLFCRSFGAKLPNKLRFLAECNSSHCVLRKYSQQC